MPLWRLVRFARAVLFAVAGVFLLLGAALLPVARASSGFLGLAADLLLAFLTVAGLFLTMVVLWSLWVQNVLLDFRLARLALARMFLGFLFLLSFVPLLFFAQPAHFVVLILGTVGAAVGLLVTVAGRRGTTRRSGTVLP